MRPGTGAGGQIYPKVAPLLSVFIVWMCALGRARAGRFALGWRPRFQHFNFTFTSLLSIINSLHVLRVRACHCHGGLSLLDCTSCECGPVIVMAACHSSIVYFYFFSGFPFPPTVFCVFSLFSFIFSVNLTIVTLWFA